MSEPRTSQRIVEAATGLIKVRGYNAFSYQDISGLVGIRKASIHHHFSTKANLGSAVVRGFMDSIRTTLEEIDASQPSGLTRIRAFTEIAAGLVEREEMCPCAMLASEAETLPASVNEAVRAYYDMVADWLARNVRRGREDGTIGLPGDDGEIAQLVLAVVQGAAITARCMKSRTNFDAAMRRLLAVLADPAATA